MTTDKNTKYSTGKLPTVVIGAGLAGISVGFALVEQGEEVIIIEASDSIASGSSYSNAGLLTASMSDPWNAPGVIWDLIRSLYDPNSPLKFKFRNLPSSFRWGISFLKNANHEHFSHATKANFLLAQYSLKRTQYLRQKFHLQYNQGTKGALKIFRNHQAMRDPRKLLEMLGQLGLRFQTVTRQEAIDIEPLLVNMGKEVVGGIYFPDDESGDAFEFCQTLSQHFEKNGGRIMFNTNVQSICCNSNTITAIETSQGTIRTKRVIIAAGHSSPRILKGHNIILPIKPVKGYSVTFECSGITLPSIPVIDNDLHTVITKLGSKLRISGIAEIAGEDMSINAHRLKSLTDILWQLYPNLAKQINLNTAEEWAGLRPVSADGLPFIGATNIEGLFINTGHGHLGWTMAAGSGQLLADQIMGNKMHIDPTLYAVHRPLN